MSRGVRSESALCGVRAETHEQQSLALPTQTPAVDTLRGIPQSVVEERQSSCFFVTGNGGAEAKEGPPAPRTHPSHRLRDSDSSLLEICLTRMCVSRTGTGKQELLSYTLSITQEGDSPGGARECDTVAQENEGSGLEAKKFGATTIRTIAFGDSVAMTASEVAWQAQTQNACRGDESS